MGKLYVNRRQDKHKKGVDIIKNDKLVNGVVEVCRKGDSIMKVKIMW